ncbi:winged helix-turn-helix transcriptional regulator [Candidatus Bathyarchaeota archaeon]|nr:winged helix-turn-helix transcriptional regulator [Candidatus Bathyarchaeota archaeon]
MYKDLYLANRNRRILYELIRKNPSIHLRELERLSGLPLSTVNYHVNYMKRKKIVVLEKDGRLSRFYAKPFDEEDKRLLKILRQKRLREIVFLVLIRKRINSKFLERKLSIPRSTLSLYLNYLLKHRVLNAEKIGYENVYSLQDEERIAKTLVTYRSSFLDSLVDKSLRTWLETRFSE